MRTRLMLSVVVVCVIMSGGCASRIIKESYYGVTGSSGHYILIAGNEQQCKQLPFKYGGVEVGTISNDIGAVCPAQFLAELPGAIREQLQYVNDSDKKDNIPFFRGGADSKLMITGVVIHYDTGDLLDQIVGPMEEVVCRLEIRDGKTDVVLAEANFVGRAKSSVRKGPQELAVGVGKGVKTLLEPKDEKK
jgi:hypothetical protein